MASSRSLKVLLPGTAGQRWSCHSCGRCCYELVGHVTEEERKRLDAQNWKDKLGLDPYLLAGGSWVLSKRPDGACVFLDDHNRCRIHSEFGEQAKPFACRIFPFSVRSVKGGWQASFRLDCPSAAASRGRPVQEYADWLARLLRGLEHDGPQADPPPDLAPATPATDAECEVLLQRFHRWLTRDDLPLAARLRGAARVTTLLSAARYDQVRGARFAELVDILFSAEEEAIAPAEPPTRRQESMLRQLAFVHAEHVTLQQLAAGWTARMTIRFRQLSRARRFHSGRGLVPDLPGLGGRELKFEVASQVAPAQVNAAPVQDLVLRYPLGRLAARSVFGAGYYGWPVFPGLGALWLSVAAAGWLARCHAAAHGRSELNFDDAAYGIGIVDRGATRLPALGTLAERTRLLYLNRDDGAARLIQRFALVPE